MVGQEFTNCKTVEETEFDENGNPVRSFTYNSLDPSSKFYTESEYSENGQTLADYDESGEHKTEYEYIPGTNVVRSQKLPNGSKFSYGHDQNDQVTAITQSTEEGEENSNQTVYTCGLATEHKSGNNVVRYEYDYKKRMTKVDLNGTEGYFENTYSKDSDGNEVTVERYIPRGSDNKSDFCRVTRNKRGDVVSVEYACAVKPASGEPTFEEEYTFGYDEKHQLSEIKKGQTLLESYTYDDLDRQTKHVFGSHSHETEYDDYGQTTKESFKFNNASTASLEYTYTYKDDSTRALAGMSAGSFAESYKTDNLGRSKEVLQTLGNKTYGRRYGYYKNGDHATNRVNAISYTRDGQTDGKVMYTYDSMGNVISVNVNGKQVEKFSYDKLGRLIFEENLDKNRKICYTYDENGNILTKSVNGEVTVYKYRPKTNFLMAFGDETFAYDGMGNPTTYRGMDCVRVRGRCLNSVSVAGKNAYYGYDESGLRKTKKIYAQSTADEPDETIQFVYENDKLLRQKNGDETIDFIYGSEGIIGFKVGNSNYLYRKNLFGDVIEIYNDESALVGKYSYTAFGVCTVELDDGGIATKNPIRYRSYYYDDETELYYLKSRYYDPEVGRFITIDDISYLAPDIINGLNLYAYCGNNPIAYIDSTGNSPNGLQDFLAFVERYFTGLEKLCKYIVKNPEQFTVPWKKVHKINPVSKKSYYRGNKQAFEQTRSMGNTFKKIAKGISLAALGIDIGLAWYNNYQSGSSSWFSDSVVDTAYIVGRYAVGFLVSTLVSMLFGGVIGWILAVGLSILVDQWIQNNMGEVLNDIKIWAAGVGESIVNGWNYFWSFAWI